ncbi:molybdate ABC transporter substrate-binding protein [Tellurirhabdus rosea]|uniref:molybdate ABC transporter substrate-binding protein n=1 Tax=Tellurirhabdus rosea TaxID=2674997 RepID=UPI002255B031|nr:molybdate ABC transporter substrate-binding protein [Tellurirhabdus rosea]
MRHAFLLWLLLTGSAFGQSQAPRLRIAVAANAQFVMEKLQAAFRKESGIAVEPIINSSGRLTTQIQQGAPFDVFLSADMDFPKILHEKGLTTEAPVVYAYGTLVVWRAGGGPLSASLKELTAPDVRHIALASPKTAPYGEAAEAALQKLKLYDNVQPKLVFGESIAQVNQYVLSGAAEVGFTAKSVVLDPKMRGKGRWVEVPGRLYTPMAQGVVVLKRTERMAEARRFVAFLKSRTARRIFEEYGYKIGGSG